MEQPRDAAGSRAVEQRVLPGGASGWRRGRAPCRTLLLGAVVVSLAVAPSFRHVRPVLPAPAHRVVTGVKYAAEGETNFTCESPAVLTEGAFTLGDALSFSSLTSKVLPLVSIGRFGNNHANVDVSVVFFCTKIHIKNSNLCLSIQMALKQTSTT